MQNSYRFFKNTDCKYFPCHKVPDEKREDFNCLFCYCPLYALGDKCGGNFTFTQRGIKDCSNCTLPHSPEGYEYINSKFSMLSELASRPGLDK